MERPLFSSFFCRYLRVTNLTFGGGTITMAALNTELVSLRKWLSQEKYATCLCLARITPGTNMLAFCAGTGWELLGWPGAIVGVAAASVPAGLMVMLLTGSYDVLAHEFPRHGGGRAPWRRLWESWPWLPGS